MAITKIISENENNIKNATIEGISGEAVGATLEDVISVADSKGATPMQVKDTVEAIVEMKSDVENKNDEKYASELLKENSGKIEEAISTGITPKEVATTLVNSTNNSNTRKGKNCLRFLVNLISKMKKKELRLNKNKENVEQKGYQKVYTDK
ncbi:MAG: hypothetical protein IJE04_01035 [Bacilli bacterium]|nr:hypothetical protein [Bacilli bacterium]